MMRRMLLFDYFQVQHAWNWTIYVLFHAGNFMPLLFFFLQFSSNCLRTIWAFAAQKLGFRFPWERLRMSLIYSLTLHSKSQLSIFFLFEIHFFLLLCACLNFISGKQKKKVLQKNFKKFSVCISLLVDVDTWKRVKEEGLERFYFIFFSFLYILFFVNTKSCREREKELFKHLLYSAESFKEELCK